MTIISSSFGELGFPPTCKKCGLVLIPETNRCADCDSLQKQIDALESKLKVVREVAEKLHRALQLRVCTTMPSFYEKEAFIAYNKLKEALSQIDGGKHE